MCKVASFFNQAFKKGPNKALIKPAKLHLCLLRTEPELHV